tara:strand:- start:1201 stop:1968 length:768 start_codon:yes stop_codon:yes gene_type:complete
MNEPLSYQEIQEIAPSIFTTQPSEKVSDKYSFIPTVQVLEDMNKLGWDPYQVSQRKGRNGSHPYSKHMIRLRNNNLGMIGDSLPELVLTNSHDGRNAFNLHAGVFRLVCANGLVIADQMFASQRIKHQWYDMDYVREITNEVVEKIPAITSALQSFNEVELTEAQRYALAKKSIKVRWTKGNDYIDVKNILQPNREEDLGNSLWNTFNVVQEKLLKGGLVYQLPQGRQQTVRALTNIDEQVRVNKGLWELAETYA